MIFRLVSTKFLRVPLVLLVFSGLFSPAVAQVVSESPAVPRHALEVRALRDPEGVLRELPDQLKKATAANDYQEQALLYLAESNACRVIADWPCQTNAAARAQAAAVTAKLPELQARGLIAESRGRMAMRISAVPQNC